MECAQGKFPYSTAPKPPPMKKSQMVAQGNKAGVRKPSFGFWDIMDNIVSSPPPALPEKAFSEECRSFISSW